MWMTLCFFCSMWLSGPETSFEGQVGGIVHGHVNTAGSTYIEAGCADCTEPNAMYVVITGLYCDWDGNRTVDMQDFNHFAKHVWQPVGTGDVVLKHKDKEVYKALELERILAERWLEENDRD